ncbi:hypothetical protein I2485_15170 [Nesterenkonia sp. E16_7]|nr:hypothetical protein [Nesterenkonia sp. E16_10]MBO0599991.1 hypothetical protein [Nesterenkonia sp. E16_7]
MRSFAYVCCKFLGLGCVLNPCSDLSSGDPCGDLLVKISSGNEEAFRELYRRHGSILWTTLLGFLRDPVLSEEVLKEVFAAIWIDCRSFQRQPETGRAWLVTLCRQRARARL